MAASRGVLGGHLGARTGRRERSREHCEKGQRAPRLLEVMHVQNQVPESERRPPLSLTIGITRTCACFSFVAGTVRRAQIFVDRKPCRKRSTYDQHVARDVQLVGVVVK